MGTNIIQLEKQYREKLFRYKEQFYLLPYLDAEEVEEDFLYVKYANKFFTKLSLNKEVNISLLVNHIKVLYNCFEANYIKRCLFYSNNCKYRTYLKTILLYLNKIDENDKLFKDTPISYDFDYLLTLMDNKV